MMAKTEITRDDIISMDEYAKNRKERRAAISLKKRDRRVACGPDAMFYFENFDTMWHQVHEMLYIEKGGDDQIDDELSAYNPLIPNGRELVSTLMFEIEDASISSSESRKISHFPAADRAPVFFDAQTPRFLWCCMMRIVRFGVCRLFCITCLQTSMDSSVEPSLISRISVGMSVCLIASIAEFIAL